MNATAYNNLFQTTDAEDEANKFMQQESTRAYTDRIGITDQSLAITKAYLKWS